MNSLISVKELFSRSLSLYMDKFWVLVKLLSIDVVAFLCVIPFGVGMVWSISRYHNLLALVLFLLFCVAIIIASIVVILVQIGMMLAVKEHNLTIAEYLQRGWTILASFVWVSFLVGIVVAVGFVLFIIPGILFSVWFSLTKYAMVFSGKKGWAAAQESKKLVQGYWWAVFGRFLLLGLVSMIISFIPMIGSLLNIFFMVPFTVIYVYFIYEDLKMIKGV